MDLFEHSERNRGDSPLSNRMRPRRLSEMLGQEHLLAPGKLLIAAVEAKRVPSMILWGPPGTGKTTLARVIAEETGLRFETMSAVLGGVAELRTLIKQSAEQKRLYGKSTLLFIDEIHRFNKAQQDALLPHVEDGTVTLIGATTENPSFAINGALLSRTRVFELASLSEADLSTLLARALQDAERGLGSLGLRAGAECLAVIAHGAQGDGRRALDVLEAAARFAVQQQASELTEAHVREALAATTLLHDKTGEGHYNVVSAFIKSMRGSDPDAALYWMMRMLEAGEDPLFVLRRMIIFASEDIGNADPAALPLAVAADQAFHRLGMPEGLYPLGHCCTYLASAPKSNASALAWQAAQRDVREHGSQPVPLKLRNAATPLMRASGYGQGYRYPHNEGGYAQGETYLPERLLGRSYYQPSDQGFEATLKARRDARGEPDPDP